MFAPSSVIQMELSRKQEPQHAVQSRIEWYPGLEDWKVLLRETLG
jgi:hypothetical protein